MHAVATQTYACAYACVRIQHMHAAHTAHARAHAQTHTLMPCTACLLRVHIAHAHTHTHTQHTYACGSIYLSASRLLETHYIRLYTACSIIRSWELYAPRTALFATRHFCLLFTVHAHQSRCVDSAWPPLGVASSTTPVHTRVI